MLALQFAGRLFAAPVSGVVRHDVPVGISDKDRKILWGRSGNRCALCRRVLVAGRTPTDDESVIGDEAHIAARSSGGPRFGECSPNKVDSYENLILLCRVDHKKVDDQPKYYTTARLRQVKAAHEAWIEQALGEVPAPIRFQFASSSPVQLRLIATGSDVWDVVQGADRFVLEDLDEEVAGPEDLDCSATFLQNARDWGEISNEVNDHGMRAVREAKASLKGDLEALRERGLLVFGGQRRGDITGGVRPPAPFLDACLIVVRADDDRIQQERA